MRTVPCSLHLNPLYPYSLTNAGRSFLQPKASQETAAPSSPATEVKVPHSWTVRSSLNWRDCPPAAISKTPETASTGARIAVTRMVDFISSLAVEVLSRMFQFPRPSPDGERTSTPL